MTRKFGKQLVWLIEPMGSCFDLIRSHQQCILWSPLLEIFVYIYIYIYMRVWGWECNAVWHNINEDCSISLIDNIRIEVVEVFVLMIALTWNWQSLSVVDSVSVLSLLGVYPTPSREQDVTHGHFYADFNRFDVIFLSLRRVSTPNLMSAVCSIVSS